MNTDYWRIYHDQNTLAWGDTHCRTHTLLSTGVRLHLDLYEQADRSAPVMIFNHGGGGYSRLFIPIAHALYERGYTVILPDQRGQGLSEGDRGDFTIGQHVENIVDVAQWARKTYDGPLYMGGGSLGGGLTYYAAAAGAPVDALILHNLYDFGPGGDGLALSRLAPLSQIPGFAALSRIMSTIAARLLPGLKIPYRWLGVFERMVDERAVGFYEQWRADPYPIQAVSLRYLHSLMTTPPAIPFERNRLRVLVINQKRDRMVRPEVTRRNYERLGGDKHYVEIDYGHWAMGAAFVSEWTAIVDGFLRRSG
ncbi:MAG: lysophospholipase [Anaerolineae bacterium]|jgi:pimeloyl-ACP methyl ester carboxylesterase|nr:lysophospholipase [Anaerolineae bacterium]